MGKKDRYTEQLKNARKPVARLETNEQTGLTGSQAKERKDSGWTNRTVNPPVKTTGEIICKNIGTYFNLIFMILALLLCSVGSYRNLTFLPVIVCNTLIGIVQEIRAKRVLEKLRMLHAPRTRVIREGEEILLDSEALVIDDIVIFAAGNQICADGIVVKGEVQVNESMLTGEADEITKRTGDQLLSGSFVVSGHCRARLLAVGVDSYISKLTIEAKAMGEGEQSEMIRSLNRLVKWMGVIIIPIGLILFCQSHFLNQETLRSSVTAMVAAVIGMIPEGLYLLASIALAVSAVRLASQKVLLHDMKSMETLARVDVLCVDKTGTITDQTMSVYDIVEVDGYDREQYDSLPVMLADFGACMSDDNITIGAIKQHFTQGTGKRALGRTSFSSAVKYSSVTYADGAYVLGAPEQVLRYDPKYMGEAIQEYTKKGFRVLAFGKYEGKIDGKALTERVQLLGYILLSNPVRKQAREVFSYFAEQGVVIKVISGDHPEAVSEVARQAHIERADSYVDASCLETEVELRAAAQQYTVFGRVTPRQKRQLVQALKEAGHTVAMTGDGVNDVLALKDADCSIAMASGSEAAAQASKVVLLESDFACMPAVVEEGRRVVNNIQRSASLFLVKNIFSLLLALFAAIVTITYPLVPSQVSLIGMFTIGIPGFLLALEPNNNRIQGHFLTNVFVQALPAGLTDVIVVGTLVVLGYLFHADKQDISTAATILLAVVGFMILTQISRPLNKLRMGILIGCMAGLVFCGIFLKQIFSLSHMSAKCTLLVIVCAVVAKGVFWLLTKAVTNMHEWYGKYRRAQK